MSERSENVGEQVGNVAEAAVAGTESAANAAVEEATRKANEAAKAAESIAAAALHTELGSRIQQIDERSVKWLEEHEANKQAMQALQTGQAMLTDTLNRLSSSLEQLTKPPTQPEQTVIVPEKEPATTKTEASEKSEAEKPAKRTRLFL